MLLNKNLKYFDYKMDKNAQSNIIKLDSRTYNIEKLRYERPLIKLIETNHSISGGIGNPSGDVGVFHQS